LATVVVFAALLITAATMRHTAHLEASNTDLKGELSQLRAEFRRIAVHGLNSTPQAGTNECTSAADMMSIAGGRTKELQDFEAALLEPPGSLSAALRTLALASAVVLFLAPVCLPQMIDTPIVSALLGREPGGAATSKRLLYLIDYWFSTYVWIKPVALLIATVWLLLVGALANYAVSQDPFSEALWYAWSWIADSGNHAEVHHTTPRAVAVMITMGGMLVFALMLGLVSDSISEKVDSLKKGKSDVIENNHTLILGWNDKVYCIVQQIANANASEGGGVIVVLSEREKEAMEEDLHKSSDGDNAGTIVVCRSGSPLLLSDLNKVSVATARSIIVLAEATNADLSDTRVLRVLLSLRGVPKLDGHVVAEISDLDNNLQVKMVGGDMVETLVAHDVIGRLMIQCARQPGLAQVFEDLLGFEGNEFYKETWPQLTGRTFGETMFAFADAVPIGIKSMASGKVVLNPPDDYQIRDGDKVLVIAEDNDTYTYQEPFQVSREFALPKLEEMQKERRCERKERVLFVGWRRDIEDMIIVLDSFVGEGSELWIFCDLPVEEREQRLREGELHPERDLKNLTLVHKVGNTVLRKHLMCLPLATFRSIMILADEGLEEDIVAADSRVLGTLLLIRELQYLAFEEIEKSAAPNHTASAIAVVGSEEDELALERACGPAPDKLHLSSLQAGAVSKSMPNLKVSSRKVLRTHHMLYPVDSIEDKREDVSWMAKLRSASSKCVVISEILDSRTKHLINITKISDYVMSNELVSMALAMVAEDKEVAIVLTELFTSEGNEMYIRPVERYINPGEEASFWEMCARVRAVGGLLVGFKGADMERVSINPTEKHVPRVWHADDSLVILAEDDE